MRLALFLTVILLATFVVSQEINDSQPEGNE